MDLDRTVHQVVSAAQLLSVDVVVAPDRRLARLDVAGELDGSTTAKLLRAVRHVLTGPVPERIELNLAALAFMDSAGIRCLLMCRTAAQDAGTRLVLVDPARQVVRNLEITGLLDLFDLGRDAGSDLRTPV